MVKVARVIDGSAVPAVPHEEERGVAVSQRIDVYALMDRLDEEAILAELDGATPEKFAYEFEVDGKTVRGLGKVGVDMLIRKLANRGIVIREIDSSWEDHGDYAVFRVVSQRFRVLVRENGDGAARVLEVPMDTLTGWKRQPKVGKKRSGDTYPIQHWFEVGFQKAARNSKRRFLPEEKIARMISQAIREGRIGRYDAQGRPTREQPTSDLGNVEKIKADMAEVFRLNEMEPEEAALEEKMAKASKGALGWASLSESDPVAMRLAAHRTIRKWLDAARGEEG